MSAAYMQNACRMAISTENCAVSQHESRTSGDCVLQAVKSQDCLEIMGKLLYNCAVSPREEKFRRIKLTNKRLAETLGANPAALEALSALGWVEDAANAHELVVPEGLYFTMKEVRGCVMLSCDGF
jgi:hypothetical protein